MVSFPVSTYEISDRHDPTNNIYSRTVTTKCYITDKNTAYSARTNGYTTMTSKYTIGKNVQHRFLIGGNVLTYSTNGINWLTSGTTIPLTTIRALEYSGTIFVAGGTNTVHSLTYSDDGIHWFGSGNTTIKSVSAIRWSGYGPRGASLFVAAGSQADISGGNTLAYSYGGLHWTGLGNAMFGGNSQLVNGEAIEWNGQFWLAAASGSPTYDLATSFTGTNQWTGISVSSFAANIYAIMWNGAQWIIGGNTAAGAGVIALSNNDAATSWTVVASCPINSRVTGFAYNGGRTVAVGNGATNTLAYSDDFGMTWTGLGVTLLNNTSTTANHRVYWSLGKFVVAGTTSTGCVILYSNDGLHWKTSTPPSLSSATSIVSTSVQHNQIRFNANFLYTGSKISYDSGITWFQTLNQDIGAVGYNGRYSISCTTTGQTYIAYDLVNAFPITTANTDASGARVIKWNGEHWLMGGTSQTNRHLLLSYDGYNWIPVATTFMTSGYYVTGMDWSPTLSRWVVATYTGPTAIQIIYSDNGLDWTLASTLTGGGPITWTGLYFMAAVNDSANTKVAVSQDGVSWNTRTLGSYGQVESIAAEDEGLNIIVTTYPNSTATAAILLSSDGTSWTPVGGTNQNWHHYSSIWDGTRFVVKTNNPTNSIRVSYDGTVWTDIGGNVSGQQILWSNPHIGKMTIYQPTIVCGRDASGNNTMAISKDGLFYRSLGNAIFDVVAKHTAWNGRMWIACGQGAINTLAYSTDGTTWVGLGKTTFTIVANRVAWNGYKWIAVGEGGNTIATSANGLEWTGLGASIIDISGHCIQYNGTTWLAGGRGTTNTLAYSTDGNTWTGLGTAAHDTEVRDIQWTTNQWLAMGISSSGNNIRYTTTTSGQTGWTNSSGQPFSTQANGAFWNGQATVAVGQGGNTIATSTDGGITWSGLGTTVFSTQGNGVAWNDLRWIVAGQGGNTMAYSNDGTLWHTVRDGPDETKHTMFTEAYGIGTNPKVGPIYIPSAISLNNRDKVCVNTPRYYDSDLADDTSLVFNLEV
jgi:hypothetical protein